MDTRNGGIEMHEFLFNGHFLRIVNCCGSTTWMKWHCYWGNKDFYITTKKDKEPVIKKADTVPIDVVNRAKEFIVNREYLKAD